MEAALVFGALYVSFGVFVFLKMRKVEKSTGDHTFVPYLAILFWPPLLVGIAIGAMDDLAR